MSTKNKIIETADRMFYEQGFENTSFADIAELVQISRGNFYYHFKTKDEILKAVINRRQDKTRQMLEVWEHDNECPKSRILCYVNILILNQTLIGKYGCPVGTLTNELAKLDHIANQDAKKIFSIFHEWLVTQFEQLGFRDEAPTLSMHILSWSQGVATMFNTFQDEDFLKTEIIQIKRWLDHKIMEK